MSVIRVNPTRMELTKLKRRLITARRGHSLLKDKRDELMRRFLILVSENKKLRRKTEEKINAINSKISYILAQSGKAVIETALMGDGNIKKVDVRYSNIMSVNVPIYDIRGDSHLEIDYAFTFTPGELDETAQELSSVFADMIKLAETEKTCNLLSTEIEKTRRRVNALERILIPDYSVSISYITMKLEESERSTTSRLMKVKDMMISQKYAGNRT